MNEPWIIMKIGKKEYAINTEYVRSISVLKPEDFLCESVKPFVRGIYRLLNSEIPVINGRKIACEITVAEENASFSKDWTSIKIDIMHWLDAIDIEVFMGERSETSSKSMMESIIDRINKLEIHNNKFIERTQSKILSLLLQNSTRAEALFNRRDKKLKEAGSDEYLNSGKTYNELAAIRQNIERYVVDAIDSIVEVYCSDKTEYAIVIDLRGTIFALAVDQVLYKSNDNITVSTRENTFLSAGVLNCENTDYNIINISKLSKVI